MAFSPKNIAILGSTGSVGQSTLDVVRASGNQLRPVALSGCSRLLELNAQAREFSPRWIIAADEEQGRRHAWSDLNGTEVLYGPEGLKRVVQSDEIDTVVAAIVGSAGLQSTWAAIEAGKQVALANKETLVVAGPLVVELARQTGAELIPVDSEHSAVFQALQAGRRDQIKRIVLTASGGPFRKHSAAELENVTVAEALAHPTWEMGPKISVDSATMMNKALEIIEARWLFDLPVEKIDVVIHPQSIVHSMVEYQDGSVLAQMSPPDMRLPIQYALTYPDRLEGPSAKLDLSRTMTLDFEPPDPERFPALELGQEVARQGGTAGAVLNAANEAAVARFLAGRLPFTGIVAACRKILDHHEYDPRPTMERLIQLDRWARQEFDKWIGA